MKLLLITLFLSCSAGRQGKPGTSVTGPKGDAGPAGESIIGQTGPAGEDGQDGEDAPDSPPAPEEGTLSAYHLLPNGGYLELLEDNDARIVINGLQRVYITNTDLSLGLLPSLSTGPFAPHNGKIRMETTLTYAAATNNMGNPAIVGNRKTAITLSRDAGERFTFNVKVFSASGLVIEMEKTVQAEL